MAPVYDFLCDTGVLLDPKNVYSGTNIVIVSSMGAEISVGTYFKAAILKSNMATVLFTYSDLLIT